MNKTDDFRSRAQKNIDKFNAKSVQMFEWNRKIWGTDVVIYRIKENSKYRQFFGAAYTSDIKGDSEIEQIPFKLIINQNTMTELWRGTELSIEVKDVKFALQIGDLIKYKTDEQLFTFKVVAAETFGTHLSIFNNYTLEAATEIQS